MGARKNLSIEQMRWLCSNFPSMSDEEIARHLKVSVQAVRYHADQRNLHKTLEYIKNVRRRGAEVTNSRNRRTKQ